MSDFLIRTMEVAPSEAKGGVRESIVIVNSVSTPYFENQADSITGGGKRQKSIV